MAAIASAVIGDAGKMWRMCNEEAASAFAAKRKEKEAALVALHAKEEALKDALEVLRLREEEVAAAIQALRLLEREEAAEAAAERPSTANGAWKMAEKMLAKRDKKTCEFLPASLVRTGK